MIHERDIRERLAEVIRRNVSLATFERWLSSESWNMFSDSSSPEAIELVSSIHLLLSQRDDNALDAAGLRSAFLSLLNNIVVSAPVEMALAQPPARPYAASSERWFEPAFRLVAT